MNQPNELPEPSVKPALRALAWLIAMALIVAAAILALGGCAANHKSGPFAGTTAAAATITAHANEVDEVVKGSPYAKPVKRHTDGIRGGAVEVTRENEKAWAYGQTQYDRAEREANRVKDLEGRLLSPKMERGLIATGIASLAIVIAWLIFGNSASKFVGMGAGLLSKLPFVSKFVPGTK